MRKLLTFTMLLLISFGLAAQTTETTKESSAETTKETTKPKKEKKKKEKIYNEKGEIIKKGWNFGPLPVVGYRSDMGFQYGACIDIFNYGDGSKYPGYDFKLNFEVSTYTKGSSVFRFYSYWNNIIPKGKLFVDVSYFIDKKFDFYGFNGYAAPYYKDFAIVDGIPSPEHGLKKSGFYGFSRNQFRFIASMQQQIGNIKGFYYGAGLAYFNNDIGKLNLKTYNGQTTLYDLYCATGLIRENEKNGGNTTQVKAGLIYDTKDYENDPTRGMYIEGAFTFAPDIIDRKGYNNLTFTGVFQHYVPLYKEHLTFAYRIGAQNVIAGDIPFYSMLNTNTLFFKKMYIDALGGASTVRGINRNRVIGKGFAWLNVDLRWRMVNFKLINQNWCIVLNPFFDAGMVTQTFRLDEQKDFEKRIHEMYPGFDDTEFVYSTKKETPHMSAGLGLKIIMNKNFVISAEFAKAFNNLDGAGMASYIGFNYIF